MFLSFFSSFFPFFRFFFSFFLHETSSFFPPGRFSVFVDGGDKFFFSSTFRPVYLFHATLLFFFFPSFLFITFILLSYFLCPFHLLYSALLFCASFFLFFI